MKVCYLAYNTQKKVIYDEETNVVTCISTNGNEEKKTTYTANGFMVENLTNFTVRQNKVLKTYKEAVKYAYQLSKKDKRTKTGNGTRYAIVASRYGRGDFGTVITKFYHKNNKIYAFPIINNEPSYLYDTLTGKAKVNEKNDNFINLDLFIKYLPKKRKKRKKRKKKSNPVYQFLYEHNFLKVSLSKAENKERMGKEIVQGVKDIQTIIDTNNFFPIKKVWVVKGTSGRGYQGRYHPSKDGISLAYRFTDKSTVIHEYGHHIWFKALQRFNKYNYVHDSSLNIDENAKKRIEINFKKGQKLKDDYKAFTKRTDTFIDTVKERDRRFNWYQNRKVDKKIYECLRVSEQTGITDYEFFARMFQEYVKYKNEPIDFSLIDEFDKFDFPPENGKPLRNFGYRKNSGEPEFREKTLIEFENYLLKFIELAKDNYELKLKCTK